jgi:hypothetical protein
VYSCTNDSVEKEREKRAELLIELKSVEPLPNPTVQTASHAQERQKNMRRASKKNKKILSGEYVSWSLSSLVPFAQDQDRILDNSDFLHAHPIPLSRFSVTGWQKVREWKMGNGDTLDQVVGFFGDEYIRLFRVPQELARHLLQGPKPLLSSVVLRLGFWVRAHEQAFLGRWVWFGGDFGFLFVSGPSGACGGADVSAS